MINYTFNIYDFHKQPTSSSEIDAAIDNNQVGKVSPYGEDGEKEEEEEDEEGEDEDEEEEDEEEEETGDDSCSYTYDEAEEEQSCVSTEEPTDSYYRDSSVDETRYSNG